MVPILSSCLAKRTLANVADTNKWTDFMAKIENREDLEVICQCLLYLESK